jgi:nicotinate dehydrogenase subunit B
MTSNPSLTKNPWLDQWISFDKPGTITIRTGKVELGQRIGRALTLIAAAELRVTPLCIELAAATTQGGPDEGYTVGSNSIEHAGDAVRLAARAAMQCLIGLGAQSLGAPPEALAADGGVIRSLRGEGEIDYWTLTLDRKFDCRIDAVISAGVADDSRFRWVDVSTREQRTLVDGSAQFIHDLQFPDMLHARVVRSPMMHGEAAGCSQEFSQQLERQGFRLIRNGSFMAIVGEDEYGVVQAAARLVRTITWRRGAQLSTTPVHTQLWHNPRVSLPVVEGWPKAEPVPPVPETPAAAAHTLELTLFKPYLMHGSLAPSAAAAFHDPVSGQTQVWTHSQGVYPLRCAIAASLGMEVASLAIAHVRGAGCYGHNGADDAALDATIVAHACPGRHVLLKWSREDEHSREPYGPAMSVKVRASADEAGKILQWVQEACSDSHLMRPFPYLPDGGAGRLLATRELNASHVSPPAQPMMFHHAGIHRNLEPYYNVGETHLVKTLVRELPLRSSSLRSLGAAGNVWAIESMMDELASRVGLTPLQIRLDHSSDPRAIDVLQRLADLLPSAAPESRPDSAWGVGFARYKNEKAYCGVAVEISVDAHANIQLQRAIIVADAGRAIDSQGMAAQLEGGFFQAASWALVEEVHFDQDGVTSRDWDSYPVLRIDRSCSIETHLLDRRTLPSLGLGEASSGPSLAAIANAASAALGFRLTRLPFTASAVQQAALEA